MYVEFHAPNTPVKSVCWLYVGHVDMMPTIESGLTFAWVKACI